jgi:NADPH:quinone reductase-like Zn-dependent oxidoreductase
VLAGARAEDAGWCRAAGADEVLDYRDPDLPDRVRDLLPLDRAAEAHQAVERGVRGRIVLRVGPADA